LGRPFPFPRLVSVRFHFQSPLSILFDSCFRYE
jgi:hypothetical protein